MHKVGIFGASGIVGGELCRWILSHPSLELGFVHSRHHGGKKLSDVHSHLAGLSSLNFEQFDLKQVPSGIDVLFLALGHGEAKTLAQELSSFKGVLVDMTEDHRWKDPDFIYGLTELHRKQLKKARRIANPGCFATATTLAALPILSLGVENMFVSAITGSSGAGASLTSTTHHPFRDENVFAYKLFQHNHEKEVNQSLGGHALTLATHSGPFVRGIHATLHATLKKPIDGADLRAHFQEFYSGSPFIRIRPEPPQLKAVVGSNFCDLHVTTRGNEVIVVSVIDNLVKGAAGQAIQNVNLALGLDEKEGLWTSPVYP